MCGIGGFYRDTSVPMTDEQLANFHVYSGLIIDELSVRGIDSAGIALFDGEDHNTREHLVRCVPGYQFTDSRAFQKTLEDSLSVDTKTALFHTRAATVGDVSKRNAHPLVQGLITGIHNGMIHNYEALAHKFDAKQYLLGETDSECLFAAMRATVTEDLNTRLDELVKPLNSTQGAAAVSMVVLGDPNLYLYRRNNPLWTFYDRPTQTLFWMSQPNMAYALQHAGFEDAVKSGTPLAERRLYRFNSQDFKGGEAISNGTKDSETSYTYKNQSYHQGRGGGVYNPKMWWDAYGVDPDCLVCKEEITDDVYGINRNGMYHHNSEETLCASCYKIYEGFIRALPFVSSYKARTIQ